MRVVLFSVLVGCGVRAAQPGQSVVISLRRPAVAAIVVPPPEIGDRKPCTLHGTGWSPSTVSVLLGRSDTIPRARLNGVFEGGVEWNDVPPDGSRLAATI